jgi:ubiquinone/menaquinone biosynthesis C-methylase UbiE
VTNVDDVRARFAATASQVAAHAAKHVESVRAELVGLLSTRGDERALDSGTGAGTLALALAPLVREVVGADVVPELLDAARRDAPENVAFVEGDATALPFPSASFDLAATRRTLHHIARPELAVAELARVVRIGGTVLVEDQIAPIDPLAALALDRFERARDPSHTRLLPDIDLRHLFEANELELIRTRTQREPRALGPYLDLAGCEGEQRERAASLSPAGPEHYVAESSWYVLRRRVP